MGENERETLSRILCGELRGFSEKKVGKRVDPSFSVLLVGLGNASLTADAVGPFAVRRLNATAHLQTEDPALYSQLGCSAVFILTPGVLGQSGMEAGRIVHSVVNAVRPDLVIAIDALAARDLERLATTIQLSDAGIVPGSGVGNHRCGLTEETLGVPVLALGVPTVVSSSTLVWHTLAKAGIQTVGEPLESALQQGRDFFVSLKECDLVVEEIAKVLSRAFSLAFLGKLAE